MRKIFLICNGETMVSLEPHPSGNAGNPLSERGRAQMEEVLREIAGEKLEKIFVSPRVCSYEGGMILSRGEIPTEFSEDIDEITDGEPAIPKRVTRFYRALLSQTTGNVAVIAHKRLLRSLIGFIEARSAEEIEHIEVEPGGIYTVEVPGRVGALLVAEVSSARMKAFRPLLELGETTVVERSLDTLTRAGVSDVIIVTGGRSEELERALEGPGRTFVRNPDYEKSDMLQSARFGLRLFDPEQWDGLFILPADVPAFTLFTAQQLMRGLGIQMPAHVVGPLGDDGKPQAVPPVGGLVPTYRGKPGYPLLLSPELALAASGYEGDDGMRGAMRKLTTDGCARELELPDPAILMDADTPGHVEKIKDYLFSLRTPGLAYCREILAWMNQSKKRLRHMEAVAFYAREMAEEFNSRGRDTFSLLLDENLTTAGGMLHDVAKGYRDHAKAGAAMLRSLGLPRVAEVVENHRELAERYFACTSPVLIVYLADKFFDGTENVGIEERFARKAERCDGAEELAEVERLKNEALRANEVYENSILGWPVG